MDITASWPGRIAEIHVATGDAVAVDQELLVIESMKMLTPVPSALAGTVADVLVSVDDFVDEGQVMLRVDPA